MVEYRNGKIYIDTLTLEAVVEKGFITSLKSKADGEEFITGVDINRDAALQLIYSDDKSSDISESKFGSIEYYQISDTCVDIRYENWNGNGIISVMEDLETGDLIIEPEAYSSRPGVRACRWNLKGIREDLELVVPLYQGMKLKMDDPIIRNKRWEWPKSWEAGLAILQGKESGFWVRTYDDRYRYKALKVGTNDEYNCLGFDTEAYGPIDNNLAAGGLAWRINVYKGDWTVPASVYRDWLWEAYDLAKEEAERAPWFNDVKMAITFCPGGSEMLDALAEKVDPNRVIIHFSNWRKYKYDSNYPTYVASKEGREFIKKAQQLGYHVMPHCNSMEVDPNHEVFNMLRDFQFRHIENKQLMGWFWDYINRRGGQYNPNANTQMYKHAEHLMMAKIHPGLKTWRHILGVNILRAVEDLSLDAIFIDITLNTMNLHNCLVENMTTTEAMKILIKHVANLGNKLTVGGEGLNEITMQGLSFAQAHLVGIRDADIDTMKRTGGCPLNAFLFGKLCKTFGYSGLSGRDEVSATAMEVDLSRGVLPTISVPDNPAEAVEFVRNPNKAVRKVFDLANS
ncbi:MAG: hypothetical protein GX213_06355 [Clostridiaceae bacterium]|nr:hypothetical protein [Clostridiaceae bacterium]